MNILLVNHYAGSPNHGMEYRPYHLGLEWIKSGHNVTIIAANFSHVRSNQPRCVTPITVEYIDNIKYVWIKTPIYRSNDFMRVVNMLSFAYQLYFMDLPFQQPDVVIDSSTYPLTIFGTNKIARTNNALLVFEVHDLWPLSPIELGGYSKLHPYIMLLQFAENFAYRKADKVVSMLPKAENHMISHGMTPEKFIYVPNGIDLSSWDTPEALPEKHLHHVNNLKKSNKFIIGYTGSHGTANALQYLIKAAELVYDDRIHFVLVGHGPQKNELKSMVRKQVLHNVSFLPPISKMAIPTLLKMIDVAYIGWNDEPLYRFGVSPNKLMDYMMAQKPVIHSTSSGNDLVMESGCGISVPPENPQAIAAAVREFGEMTPESLKNMGQKGKHFIETYHDYQVLAKRFLEAL